MICIPKALFHRPTYIHTNSLFHHRQFFSFLTPKPDPHNTLYLLAYLWSSLWFHWRCGIMVSTALIFNNRLSITSPHMQAFQRREASDISPPWRWLCNLAPYTHSGLWLELRRLVTPSEHDFGCRLIGLTSGPLAWARRLATPSENDFDLKPTAWDHLTPALYIKPTNSLFKSD